MLWALGSACGFAIGAPSCGVPLKLFGSGAGAGAYLQTRTDAMRPARSTGNSYNSHSSSGQHVPGSHGRTRSYLYMIGSWPAFVGNPWAPPGPWYMVLPAAGPASAHSRTFAIVSVRRLLNFTAMRS